MALFSKPEVTILKGSSDAAEYLRKLEGLLPKTSGELKEKIEKEIQIARAGIFGEETILYKLKNSGIDMIVLHDLFIEAGEKSAQIDYYVITPKINFILECKNLFGDIEINSKGDFIRTIQYGKKRYKEGIYSPVTQNERHMAVLKEKEKEGRGRLSELFINHTFESFYQSLVVLSNPKSVVNDRYAKKEIKQQIVRADQLISVMKQMIRETKQAAVSRKKMQSMAERVLSWNLEERKDYFAKYRQLYEEFQQEEVSQEEKTVIPEAECILCPKCGGNLVKRNGRYGAFYGCSSYPKCRYTLAVKEKS